MVAQRSIRHLDCYEDVFTCAHVTHIKTFLEYVSSIGCRMETNFPLRGNITGSHDGTIDYKCGHCKRDVAGVIVGAFKPTETIWLACPKCKHGSVLNSGVLAPASLCGEDVKGLPRTVQQAYMEARKSISSESYTACDLLCRKILMNVAVEKGACEGESFVHYIDYIVKEGHITNVMTTWIKKIKDNGNEATHVINPPNFKKTSITLKFTEFLLKNVYETEYYIKENSGNST